MVCFPDIATLAFEAQPQHIEFCAKNDISLVLLHSHHGHSELFFFKDAEGGLRSRPPTAAEKLTGTPCSFYLNEDSEFVAFEWADIHVDRRGLKDVDTASPFKVIDD